MGVIGDSLTTSGGPDSASVAATPESDSASDRDPFRNDFDLDNLELDGETVQIVATTLTALVTLFGGNNA